MCGRKPNQDFAGFQVLEMHSFRFYSCET